MPTGPARARPVNGRASGLLLARCDPYGAESSVNLLGGMYPESHLGRIMWHCPDRATARYRMTCTGGVYGERPAKDGGTLPGFICPGGHSGQVMPLCDNHRRAIARRQAGLCPACAWPPAARVLTEVLERTQTEIQAALALGMHADARRLISQFEGMQARMNELLTIGSVHRCPLELAEVS